MSSDASPDSKKPKRIDQLVINDEGDTPSMMNVATGQIFITNWVGKKVMELADGRRTVNQIVDELANRYADPGPQSISQDVRKHYKMG